MEPHHDPTGAFVDGPRLLESGRVGGPLSGRTFVAKELIDVAGQVTGAGNPTRRATTPPAVENAPVVDALLGADADLMGTTVTDELAFSLAGTNVHDGTPRHPIDPDRVPGGSSSGSASAVANGVVDLGIGTDTGGSIRVPASYCGVYGLRTTHGRVSTVGVVPLAPSFDVVGLLARRLDVLASAAAAVLEGQASSWEPTGFLLADDLLALADPDVVEPFVRETVALAARAGLPLERGAVFERGELDDALLAFRTRQLREAWQSHGAWITEAAPRFGPGVAARFAASSRVTDDDVEAVAAVAAVIARRLSTVLDAGYVIVQPGAAGVAPKIERRTAGDPDRPVAFDASVQGRGDDLRRRILTLTSPAGLAGLPVLVLPLVEVGALPVGIALVGAAGGDEALLALAVAAERSAV